MRAGHHRVALLAALVVALLPGVARAQAPVQTNTWLVTGFGGVALDEDADASLTLGAAAAYALTSQLAVEGELGHVFDTAPGDADVDQSLTTVHGTVLYFLNTDYKLTPYLAAGLGIGKFSAEVTDPPDEFHSTEVGFNLGAGVVYPLSEGVLFRGDFRFLKHIDDVPSVWRFAGGISFRVGP